MADTRPRGKATRPKEPPATEAEVLGLLERHYAKPGYGGAGEYAFMRQVRNASGFDAKRTFDAVVVGLWPSRGHDIHVLEVKVSRSDWQRELAKPEKAEDAAKVADRFSVVAPRGIVDLAEVPATWGLIEIHGGIEEECELPALFPGDEPRKGTRVVGRKVRTVRAAPLLHDTERCRAPIPRSFLVPMLRAAGAVPEARTPDEVAIAAAVREAEARIHEQYRAEAERKGKAEETARQQLQTIKRALGLRLYNPSEETLQRELGRVRNLMKMGEGPEGARESMAHARTQLERLVSDLKRAEATMNRAAGTQLRLEVSRG